MSLLTTTTSLDDTATRLAAQTEALRALARALVDREGFERSPESTLDLVVAGAVAALPAVEGAGATLVGRDGTVTSHAPSDAIVATLDGLQDELGEGPRPDCLRAHAPVVGADLGRTGTDRWPRFAPAALEQRVGAVCSVPLVDRDDRAVGTLNLYALEPDAFDASCLATASLIASHGALAVHAARRVADLHDALGSRDVIGQAKGILIERFGLTDQQAFDKLVTSSQDTNVKLREVAAWLVADTGRGRDGAASDLAGRHSRGLCRRP